VDARGGPCQCALATAFFLVTALGGCTSLGQITFTAPVRGNVAVDDNGAQAFLSEAKVRVAILEGRYGYSTDIEHLKYGRLRLSLTNTGDKSVAFGDVLVLFSASSNTSAPENVSPASSANVRAPDRMGKEGITLAPGQTETLEFNALFFPQSLFLRYRIDGKPFEAIIGLAVRR
jgi:hypothetical protein